jgi:UDP-N-acetylmuramate--alanine ligase
MSEDADFRAVDIHMTNDMTRYRCLYRNEPMGEFAIRQLGNHNAVNSLSAIAVALELGLPADTIREGLAEFRGVGRRIEFVGESAGVRVYDDYGHHPTEIRATLEAVKNLGKRVVVVFQPHRYTRTQLLWDEFGQCFANADLLFLTEIYPAGEPPIEGVSSRLIQEAVARHDGRDVEIISRFEEIPGHVASRVREDDIVITLGAGDIYKTGVRIIEEIKKRAH